MTRISRFILAIAVFGGGLLTVLGMNVRFLSADDQDLRLEGYGYRFQGQAIHAVVYDSFMNHRPKQLFFLWAGKRLWREFLWYDNGQMMADRSYKDGLPDGVWKMWYEDGSPKSLKTYVDGVIDGEGWVWHSNGQVSDFNVFHKGQEITHKSWIFDGTPYYNYVYQNGEKIGIKGGEFCKRLEILRK